MSFDPSLLTRTRVSGYVSLKRGDLILGREQVVQVGRDCGVAGLNPIGSSIARPSRTAAAERFALPEIADLRTEQRETVDAPDALLNRRSGIDALSGVLFSCATRWRHTS